MASMTKHNFQWHNYKRPTFCAHCGNLLVGVIKQGMRCKRCNVDVHDKCQEDLDRMCIELIVGQHNFRERTYKQPTYCDYCKKLLVGLVNQGLKCSECGTNVHEKCQEKIEAKCEQTQSRKTIERSKREKISRRDTKVKRDSETKITMQTMDTPSGEAEDCGDANPLFATMPKTKRKSKQLESPALPQKLTPAGSPAGSPRPSRSSSMASGATPATTPGGSKIQQTNKLVDEVVDIMKDNVDKMSQRGEKLETLRDNAEELEKTALTFKKKSEAIKKKMWWKNRKLMIILIVVVLIVVAIIVVAIVMSSKKKK